MVYVVLADHQAFFWIRGKNAILDFKKLKKYHRRISLGLGLMILSGAGLFWPIHAILLYHNPFFTVKMICVVLLVINAFVIGSFMKVATSRTFSSLTLREKLPLFLSGAISTICWLTAGIMAFFILG
jgi:uncharacterized membrane protein